MNYYLIYGSVFLVDIILFFGGFYLGADRMEVDAYLNGWADYFGARAWYFLVLVCASLLLTTFCLN